MRKPLSFKPPVFALFNPVGGNRGEALLDAAMMAWEGAIDVTPSDFGAGVYAVQVAIDDAIAKNSELRGGDVHFVAVRVGETLVGLTRGKATLYLVRGDVAHKVSATGSFFLEVLAGDVVLLASPDLASALSDEMLVTASRLPTSPEISVRLYKDARRKSGGRNLSVLAIRVSPQGEADVGNMNG